FFPGIKVNLMDKSSKRSNSKDKFTEICKILKEKEPYEFYAGYQNADNESRRAMESLHKMLVEMPSIFELCWWYQNADENSRKAVDKFITAVVNLDHNTRDAFINTLAKKRYGSFTFIFKAGECIGFDWKSSHRKK
ncbi:MAG: hypothetical protein QMC90_02045, partial [Dehalococcoidales bacterium]|nr:hypothetical protein [Dehalococcoidales bacterium]